MYTQTYMSNIGDKEIEQAVIISGLSGYTGKYKELGGGEINDTFKLELEDLLGQKVDLVEYAAIKPGLRERILGEEIKIYG